MRTVEDKKLDTDELNLALQRLAMPNAPNITTNEIQNSPFGGQGIFATRTIPRGYEILAEPALFSIPNFKEPLSNTNIARIQREAVNYPQFQQLACRPNAPATDEGRFETNNFEMGKDKNSKRNAGIFFNASRFNHSCVPNAYFTWNHELGENPKGRLTVHAVQQIQKGDEIFLNYQFEECYETRNNRQQQLRTDYGFTCTCIACQAITPFGIASEQRRARMRILDGAIRRNRNQNTPAQKHSTITELIHLLQEEGLVYPQLAIAYRHLARFYETELRRVRAGTAGADDVVAAYGSRCRMSVMQAFREKLDLDVLCTGHESLEVRLTLASIRKREQ